MCPQCLYLLGLCRQVCDSGDRAVKRGGCNSCDEKSRFLIMYKVHGFPESVLALPYFLRLAGFTNLRICPKCITVLEFVKRLMVLVTLNAVPEGNNNIVTPLIESPPPNQRSIEVNVNPPPTTLPVVTSPASVVKLINSKPLVQMKLSSFATPLKLTAPPVVEATPPPPPSLEKRPPKILLQLHSLQNANPSPTSPPATPPAPLPPAVPHNTVHPDIRLPKGVTWQQLACFVDLRNQKEMRVPPIRIKDLKFQSIMKKFSPVKSAKRVSFDRFSSQRTYSLSSSDDSDEVALKVPAKSPETKATNERRVSRSTRSSKEALPVLKRPRRLSTIVVDYEEMPPFTIDSDTDDVAVDAPRPGQSKWPDDPPAKKFKVFRPREMTKPVSTTQQPRPTPTPTPVPQIAPKFALTNGQGTSKKSSSTGKRTIIVLNKFKGNSGASGDYRVNGIKSPPSSSSQQSAVSISSSSPAKISSQERSPQRRSRRLSFDCESTTSEAAYQGGNSPAAKIENRRRTMNPTQKEFGAIRVISFEKLRAPNPNNELLLTGRQPPMTVLAEPFLYSSP